MDVEERLSLVLRYPTEEVITVEELRELFQGGYKLNHYIGFEISGFIHIGTGVVSMVITARKIRRVGGRVFECCTGLGYTAIEALRRGARQVVTVEVDPNVLTLAMYNPFSRGLWSPAVDIVVEDCLVFIAAVRDSSFDYVIHDPPRLSHV